MLPYTIYHIYTITSYLNEFGLLIIATIEFGKSGNSSSSRVDGYNNGIVIKLLKREKMCKSKKRFHPSTTLYCLNDD